MVSQDTGEQRFWVCEHAATRTCHELIAANVPAGSTLLDTDEGILEAAPTYAAGTNPRSVAVGDFNGDGVQDLAVAID